jgi:hypothetical protein
MNSDYGQRMENYQKVPVNSHLNQHNLKVPNTNYIYLLELYLVNSEHIRPNLKQMIRAPLKHSLIPLLESEASKLQTVQLIFGKQLTISSARSPGGNSMLNSVNIAAATASRHKCCLYFQLLVYGFRMAAASAEKAQFIELRHGSSTTHEIKFRLLRAL